MQNLNDTNRNGKSKPVVPHITEERMSLLSRRVEPADAKKIRQLAIHNLDENKAIDIVCSDLGVVNYCDYIIVCTGKTSRQVKALTEHLQTALKHSKLCDVLNIEGEDFYRWVVIDTMWVVIHIQMEGIRELYDLESQWFEPQD